MLVKVVLLLTFFIASNDCTLVRKDRDNEKIFKVLVSHPEVPQEAIDLFAQCCEVVQVQSFPPNRSEILEKVKGVDGIFWGNTQPLNAEVLDAAGSQLKSISTMSAGFDYVDVNELKKRNIPLGHTPAVVNNAVADLAVGLLIAASRRFHEAREEIVSNQWKDRHLNWLIGKDISGSTVGFYGFGRIGQTIAKRLSGFDIEKVLYTTRRRIPEEVEAKYNAKKVSFGELLEQSDFIIIAAPLSPETKGVFNATTFGKMKNSAVLVNIGRGPIVNKKDLYTALKTNRIFAAGLDVVEPEPLPADEPILSLPNLVVTPHIGTATRRTYADMATLAAENILKGLAGEAMLSSAF